MKSRFALRKCKQRISSLVEEKLNHDGVGVHGSVEKRCNAFSVSLIDMHIMRKKNAHEIRRVVSTSVMDWETV